MAIYKTTFSASHPGDSIVVVMLGERGSGKSSAANIILGWRAFQTDSETRLSSKQTGLLLGRQVTVVDTPGWTSRHSSSTLHTQSLYLELQRAMDLCSPGPDVVLLVLPSQGTFNLEDCRAMEAPLVELQTPIWQRAIVIFTHGAQKGPSGSEDQPAGSRALLWLLERCGFRHHMLDPRAPDPCSQLHVLLAHIDQITEATQRQRDLHHRMYSGIRQELRAKAERKRTRGEGGERFELVVVDGRMERRRNQLGGDVKSGLGLVLLGRRRAGKSSVGDTILGRGVFQAGTKTTQCKTGQGEVAGWSVAVVDTPGWSRFGLAKPQQVREEIGRSASLCSQTGSEVSFLLAIPVDVSFGDKYRGLVDSYLGVLGQGMWRHTVVLFTFADQLGVRTIEEHIEQQGAPLRDVLRMCGGRYRVFQNNMTDAEEQTQIIELLETVEQL